MPPINPTDFVTSVQPLLEGQDVAGLLALLKRRWSGDQIISLLTCENTDARKVAALALALVGGKCCIDRLCVCLRDPDPMVNQMAEHALWSIWFRSGTPEANHQLHRGSKALNRRDYDHAAEHFTRAIEFDPTFAEAYNQRAIVRYLQERYSESIVDCNGAVERMPCHFGAWAGMGHCHAHQGRIRSAVSCYERALEVNPHLEALRLAVVEFRARLNP